VVYQLVRVNRSWLYCPYVYKIHQDVSWWLLRPLRNTYFKFVQVEGDGTLVPATEDDVLQFEHFLHDEKVDLPSIEDVGHVEEFFSNDCILLKKSDLEGDINRITVLHVFLLGKSYFIRTRFYAV
jgi:hypothetical protein